LPRWLERILLILSDLFAFNLAFILLFMVRFQSGMYTNAVQLVWVDMRSPALILTIFWFALFLVNRMYLVGRAVSRSDELINLIKYVSLGLFLLYLITVDLDNPVTFGKSILLIYGLALILLSGTGRMVIRTLHRNRLAKGLGLARTVIVGFNRRALDLQDVLVDNTVLGYQPLGFIALEGEHGSADPRARLPVLGGLDDVTRVIAENRVEEVILALDREHHDQIVAIFTRLETHPVRIKINPDMYDAVSGLARTQQLAGMPLIDIMPEFMPLWERIFKRGLDIVVSLLFLTLSLPVSLVIAIAIKLDTPGPVIFSQERVGYRGRHFRVHKFRTMREDAEAETGPVWATENDPRVTRVGRFLRHTRLDEIPQIWNVLKNDMSLVGPRPERPYVVEKITALYPLYPRRHRVKPGITGWAQVKHSYDTTLEASRIKLKFDLFYMENISLRLDFKIILNTIYVMFSGKGSR